MAPIKLEDNMKERLEERTIEPTVAAWDRISSKLDAEQGVQKSKRVLWMSIAASFVGGALIALFVFQNMDTNTSPVLVEANENPIFIDPIEEAKTIKKEENKILEEVNEAVVIKEESRENKKQVEKATINSQDDSLKDDTRVAQAVQNTNTSSGSNKGKTSAINEIVVAAKATNEEIQNTTVVKEDNAFAKAEIKKTDVAIAQVENKESILNAEVNDLLKNAQREIVSNQTFNQKTNTVDANALLLDVEAEVAPTSFRNKIFDAVVEGFEKTKDAVVNRNN